MKKFLMALVLSLAMSASCFAAGAAGRFAAEEKAADALIAALTGNGGTYEQVSKSFSQALKAKLTAQQFAAVQDGIKKQVGTIKNPSFVILNKQYNPEKGYNGIDDLVYFGTVAKDKFARIHVSFIEENNASKVVAFQVTPIEPAKQQPAPAKK
jgi:hypothetical protein